MTFRIHRRRNRAEALAAVLAVLLVYATGTLQGFLHYGSATHFHSDEIVSCHAAAEVDPCHIAMYHGGIPDCTHETHLFASVHECDLCDLLPNFKVRDWVQVRIAVQMTEYPFLFSVPELRQSDPAVHGILLRGPPVLV